MLVYGTFQWLSAEPSESDRRSKKKVKFQALDPKKRKGKQAPEQAPEESEPDTADEANDGAQEWMFISYPVIPIPWPIGLKRQDYFRIYFLWISWMHPCRNTNLWRSLVMPCWPKSISWMSCLASWMKRWNKMSLAHTVTESTSGWLRFKITFSETTCVHYSIHYEMMASTVALALQIRENKSSGP